MTHGSTLLKNFDLIYQYIDIQIHFLKNNFTGSLVHRFTLYGNNNINTITRLGVRKKHYQKKIKNKYDLPSIRCLFTLFSFVILIKNLLLVQLKQYIQGKLR